MEYPLRRLTVFALALVLGVGACRIGTDLPTEDVGELETDEALGITTELLMAVVQNTVFSEAQTLFYHAHGPHGLHSHRIEGPYTHDSEADGGPLPSSHNLFNIDLSFNVACTGGGSVLVEAAAVGEGNPLIQRGFIDYEWGLDHQECGFDAGGELIVLSTPPYVIGMARSEFDGAQLAEISGTLTGGIRWEAEAKAGECEMELAFAATGTSLEAITEIPVTGSFCGLPVDESIPVR